MNYSGSAAVGYELQWACGSRVMSYSGPVAVGLRVTVGLYCGSGVTSYSQEGWFLTVTRNPTTTVQAHCNS